jgi:hypothetical protein
MVFKGGKNKKKAFSKEKNLKEKKKFERTIFKRPTNPDFKNCLASHSAILNEDSSKLFQSVMTSVSYLGLGRSLTHRSK